MGTGVGARGGAAPEPRHAVRQQPRAKRTRWTSTLSTTIGNGAGRRLLRLRPGSLGSLGAAARSRRWRDGLAPRAVVHPHSRGKSRPQLTDPSISNPVSPQLPSGMSGFNVCRECWFGHQLRRPMRLWRGSRPARQEHRRGLVRGAMARRRFSLSTTERLEKVASRAGRCALLQHTIGTLALECGAVGAGPTPTTPTTTAATLGRLSKRAGGGSLCSFSLEPSW